ncbi:MAG: hypothetical protein J0L88_07400 [Xanthomonadales bacterium]|nr:hypothetical protein [Xanthomonadales bacterium]
MRRSSFALLAGALLLAPFANAAEEVEESTTGFSGNVAATSEYIYRGISQSDDRPALQLNGQYTLRSGIYFGLWGSTVDFGDSTDAEIDTFIGWAGDIAEEMNLDVQLVRYNYLDEPAGTDYAYNEVVGILSAGDIWSFTAGYTNDYLNTGTDSIYAAVGSEWAIGDDYMLNLGVGYTTVDGPIEGYLDYAVGISRAFGPVRIGLGYTGTNSDARRLYGRDAAEAKIALTVTVEG